MSAGKEITTSRRKEGEGMTETEGVAKPTGVVPPLSQPCQKAGVIGTMEEFDPEGIPPEIREILRGILSKQIDSGLAHDPMDHDVMPSKEQLGLGPGDLVAITHTEREQGGVEESFTIAEIVSPEEHAEAYPDWEDRLLNSFVLTKWFMRGSPTGGLGWFPRSKLVKFSKEHWEIMLGWITGVAPFDVKSGPPDWLIVRYNESLLGLAEANPGHMPVPILCPECDSPAVIISVTHHSTEEFCMGTPEPGMEWNELHVVTPYLKSHQCTSRMVCKACGHDQVLPDDVELYGH
jgi:hypothetical protein